MCGVGRLDGTPTSPRCVTSWGGLAGGCVLAHQTQLSSHSGRPFSGELFRGVWGCHLYAKPPLLTPSPPFWLLWRPSPGTHPPATPRLPGHGHPVPTRRAGISPPPEREREGKQGNFQTAFSRRKNEGWRGVRVGGSDSLTWGGKQALQHMCSLTSPRANSFLLYHRRRG